MRGKGAVVPGIFLIAFALFAGPRTAQGTQATGWTAEDFRASCNLFVALSGEKKIAEEVLAQAMEQRHGDKKQAETLSSAGISDAEEDALARLVGKLNASCVGTEEGKANNTARWVEILTCKSEVQSDAQAPQAAVKEHAIKTISGTEEDGAEEGGGAANKAFTALGSRTQTSQFDGGAGEKATGSLAASMLRLCHTNDTNANDGCCGKRARTHCNCAPDGLWGKTNPTDKGT
ncbi:variant surface glycoprotein (VSG), putative, (fragment), partial [Trypanosoma vivax Y486]